MTNDWYRDKVVWGFYKDEDEYPCYCQGRLGENEICDPITAKEANGLVEAVLKLKWQLFHLKVALTISCVVFPTIILVLVWKDWLLL